MEVVDKMIHVGVTLHVRQWGLEQEGRPFLLVHGLASNARTWDGVARHLVKAGHPVTAVDQRGHGRSEKPDDGYDFDTVTSDLSKLIDALGLQKPVMVGQSWGGNVMLAFAARYPGVASHYVFVDGGFLELSKRGPWDQIKKDLRPPLLEGTPRVEMKRRITQFQPDWSEEGIEGTLANFETRADGTVAPWLKLDNHMKILRALYEQRPRELYDRVQEPVLICVANEGTEWSQNKREPVEVAAQTMPRAVARWFDQTAHDIHVHRPKALAQAMLDFVSSQRV